MDITRIVTLMVILSIMAVCLFDLGNNTSRSLHPLTFRLKRISVWLPMGMCYALFYCCRYNISSGNTAAVRAELNLTASDFSLVITSGFWCYAFTAPFTGYISDRIGGRSALLISSFFAGLVK